MAQAGGMRFIIYRIYIHTYIIINTYRHIIQPKSYVPKRKGKGTRKSFSAM